MENEPKTAIFIEGCFKNSKTGKCQYHVWPSCHPAQVGPEDVFCCTHKSWPSNRYGDFEPIVNCEGKAENCELKKSWKWIKYYKSGLTRRLHYAREKLAKIEKEREEFLNLIK